MSDTGELKDTLLAAPASQLDAKLKPLIEKWDNPPKAIQILEVLDLCINGGLASDFMVMTFQVIYKVTCEREGVTHDDMVKRATWRSKAG